MNCIFKIKKILPAKIFSNLYLAKFLDSSEEFRIFRFFSKTSFRACIRKESTRFWREGYMLYIWKYVFNLL